MEDINERSGRKVYEKPKLMRIELVADEVLGTGCKVTNGAPGAAPPLAVCGSSSCALTFGS